MLVGRKSPQSLALGWELEGKQVNLTSMHELPFVVVYGKAVWVASLCAAALLGPTLLLWRARRARKRDAAHVSRVMDTPLGLLSGARDGQVVTAAGTLEVDEPCRHFDDGAAVAAVTLEHADLPDAGWAPHSRRAGRLDLVLDSGRVSIEGAVSVIAGSTGRFGPCRDSDLRAGDEETELKVKRRLTVLRSVAPGERVRARGRLRRRAGKAAGYRDDAPEWSLQPEADAEGVLIAAERHHQELVPMRFWPRALPLGFVGAVAFVIASAFAGKLLMHVGVRGELPPATISTFDPLAIASIIPFQRSAALDAMAARIEASTELSARRLGQQAELDALRGECAVRFLLRHRFFAQAAADAQSGRCGAYEAVLAARGLFLIGEFERASRLVEAAHAQAPEDTKERRDWPQAEERLRLHVSAGRFALAAKEARAIVRKYDDGDPPEWDYQRHVRSMSRCVAAEIATLTGELADSDVDPQQCPQLPIDDWALLRDRWFWASMPVRPSHALPILGPVWDLWDAEPASATGGDAIRLTLLSVLRGHEDRALAWFRLAETKVRAKAAEAEALLREHADELSEMQRAEADRWVQAPAALSALGGVLAMRRGDDAAAEQAFSAALDEPDAHWRAPPLLVMALTRPDILETSFLRHHPQAQKAAVAGDLRPLTEELTFEDYILNTALPYLAARAERGKRELLSWYRFAEFGPCKYCSFDRILATQLVMRDLGDVLGDPERARYWQGAIDRTLQVLRDEERARILLLLAL